MPIPSACPLQVIAMHGWSGTAAGWEPWRSEAEARGWRWSSGERGYGAAPPFLPAWEPDGLKVLITHSMGAHLLPPSLLAQADRVVLLAGFGRFVPPGREGRQLRTALSGMAAALAEGPDPEDTARRAQALLQAFLAQAAAPDPATLMPPGPADGPVGPDARRRLRDDLALLEATTDLPEGFPDQVPVLLVEAGNDQIVVPKVRELLRQRLPAAERILLPGAGHAFLTSPPQAAVLQWLERTGPS
jgi:pimeloyl-[acyl-carrier protein] methyl ester esterase